MLTMTELSRTLNLLRSSLLRAVEDRRLSCAPRFPSIARISRTVRLKRLRCSPITGWPNEWLITIAISRFFLQSAWRESGETRTLRFWIYLTDVIEPRHGPFTYLPIGSSRQVPNTFFPGRVTDEQMDAFDFSIFDRPLTGQDYLRRKGPVYQLIWGRGITPAGAEKFLEKVQANLEYRPDRRVPNGEK